MENECKACGKKIIPNKDGLCTECFPKCNWIIEAMEEHIKTNPKFESFKVFDIHNFPKHIVDGFWQWRGDYNRTSQKFTVESGMVGQYGYAFHNEITTILLEMGIPDGETVIIWSE